MKTEGSRNKHEMKSEATRAALLRAAETIFARDGYELAQIDEIAERSGRTRGAVYAQFKTKEQLFFALHEDLFGTAARDFESLSLRFAKEGPGGRLAALREVFSSVDDPPPSIIDLEVKLHAIRHPESASEWREHYQHFTTDRPFAKEFGVQRTPGTSRIESRLIALAALKGSILLTHLFLPDLLTKNEAKLLLGELFDSMFVQELESDQERKAPNKPKRAKPKKASLNGATSR